MFQLISPSLRLTNGLMLGLAICSLGAANKALASDCAPLPAKAIPFKQALERALCINAQLRQSEAQLRRSSASVDEQTSGASPQINALVSAAVGLQADESYTNHSQALTQKIILDYKLFDGGARRARVQQKNDELNANRWDALAQKQAIVFEFLSLWVSVLDANAAAQASKAALAAAQNSHAAAQARFDAGAGAMIDVLTAQSNALQAQREASRAEQKMRQQNTLLHSRLTLNQTANPLDLDRTDEAAMMLAWNQAIPNDWLQAHPSYQAQQLKKQASQSQLAALKADVGPSVSLSGAIYPSWSRAKQMGQSSTSNKLAADVAINLSIPLYDGGVNQAKYRELNAQIDSDTAQLEHTHHQLQEAFLNRQSSWQLAQSDVRLTQQALDAATLTEAAHRARYASGLGVLADLLNAQNDLANRQKQHAQAQHELLRASADRAYAVGLSIETLLK